jgi:regulatory protein
MGVLRYFPGSEPEHAAEPATSLSDAVDSDSDVAGPPAAVRPAVVVPEPEPEPGWAVPGLSGLAGADRFASPEPPLRPEISAKAERISLGALSRHDVTEFEMRAKLFVRGFDDDESEAEVERLKQVGLIDDLAVAERLLTSLRDRKGLADGSIASALRVRHIPQDVIDSVLADPDEEANLDRLEALARERARRLGSLEPAVAERRLMAYLMRKGYSGNSVRDAVRRALASQPLR